MVFVDVYTMITSVLLRLKCITPGHGFTINGLQGLITNVNFV